MKSPLLRSLCASGLLCALPFVAPAEAEPLQFALLARQTDQRFFIQAGEGCAEAARAQGDSCVLLGSAGAPHFRRQNQALEQAFDRRLNGIALAVTHSEWLAEHALKKQQGRPPLITFNSDLEPAEQHLRKGYVGLDNLALGRRLGMLLQHLRPQGGKLCVLTGNLQEPHHNERLQGIRRQLAGIPDQAGIDRLRGENGWSEPNRCPLERAENQEHALLQLTTLLNTRQFDVIVNIGGWLIDQPDAYRQRLAPLLAGLGGEGRRPTIVIATSAPDAAQRALLDEGLVQAYLDMNSRELGRQSYWMLKRLVQGEPVPERVIIDSFDTYLPEAEQDRPAEP